MDTFSMGDLRRLAAAHQGSCVSVFMPTHVAGRDGQQDALRLKNLLAEAERTLIEQGVRSSDARRILDPVRDLPNDFGFWEKRSQGLAVFVNGSTFDRYRVPLALDESVVVNQRFQIKPMLPLLGTNDLFFVLALSQHRIRLLEGRQHSLRELPVEGLPNGMDDALNVDNAQRARQTQSGMRVDHGARGNKQAAVFHGQGDAREAAKDDLTQYFRIIDAAMRPVLREQKTPMILAGVQYLLPIFREVATYPHISPDELPGNPDHLNEHDLHAKAWPLVERHVLAARQSAVEKFHALGGSGRAIDDLGRIVAAAHRGQVETLFVERHRQQWGTFDPASGQVELHPAQQPGDDELLDLAAVQTMLSRGDVFAVDAASLPAKPAAAVLRY